MEPRGWLVQFGSEHAHGPVFVVTALFLWSRPCFCGYYVWEPVANTFPHTLVPKFGMSTHALASMQSTDKVYVLFFLAPPHTFPHTHAFMRAHAFVHAHPV